MLNGRHLAAVPVLPGFVERYGPILYADIAPYWLERIGVLRTSVCEIPHCTTGSTELFADHCHRHGWVRGLVCPSHNTRLGQVDAVRELDGLIADFSCTVYGAHLANCWPCGGYGEPADDLVAESLAALRRPWKMPEPLPGELVRRPDSLTAHMAISPTRTWCGLNADAMIPAPGWRKRCIRCDDREVHHRTSGRVPEIPKPRPINWQRQDALF
jgi:hypothetical protein